MRLIFLFYSNGSAPPDKIPSFDLSSESSNKYAIQFKTDGLYYVFGKLLDQKAIDEVLIVMESARSPGYVDTGRPDMRSIVIPHISCLTDQLREDDLIFTRGGFRSWHDWLVDRQKEGYWAWLYAANTGRQRWPWWDLIMEDLSWDRMGSVDRHGRQYFDYRKPINPEYFFPSNFPSKEAFFEYDFMIGASYITDKKGQWKVVNALRNHKNIFGTVPRCIMPGSVRRGVKTLMMFSILAKDDLRIERPGFVDRRELGRLMRHTKFYISAGASGQNDRGALEALACGCQLIINSPRHHHPILSGNGAPTFIQNCSNTDELTYMISELVNTKASRGDRFKSLKHLEVFTEDRLRSLGFCNSTHGVDLVIVPDFKKILEFFKKYPKRSTKAKKVMSYELR